MGEHRSGEGDDFWRAGEVCARKARGKPESRSPGKAGNKAVTTLRSNKRVRFEEEKDEGKVLDTSKWKVHLKINDLYNYTINVEDGDTGEHTRKFGLKT